MTAEPKTKHTAQDWRPSSEMIRCRDRVAAAFDVSPEEITGETRLGHIVRARRAAVWVLRRRWPKLSFERIGAGLLGGREHSTIMYSDKCAEAERAKCASFRATTDALAAAVTPIELTPVPFLRSAPSAWLRPPKIKSIAQHMRERPVKRKNALTIEDLDAVKRRTGTIALGKAIDAAYCWDANGSPVAREAPALPATKLPSGADAELAALGFGS